MPIPGIEQPKLLEVDEELRLRKYDDNDDFALAWYQDEETLIMVDGVYKPYDMQRLKKMYHYLRERGEVYFIELKNGDEYRPVGDITFWKDDMPRLWWVRKIFEPNISGGVRFPLWFSVQRNWDIRKFMWTKSIIIISAHKNALNRWDLSVMSKPRTENAIV